MRDFTFDFDKINSKNRAKKMFEGEWGITVV